MKEQMKQTLLNKIKIFKLRVPLTDKIKLFVLSTLLIIFKKFKIKPPAVEVQMLPNKNKVHIYDDIDIGTFLDVFLNHEYDIDVQVPIKKILDLGANAGYTSIYLADKFKDSQIIAVEPDIRSIQKIKLNTTNYTDRIILEPSAVSPDSGEVAFYLNFEATISGSTIMRDSTAKKVIVPSISLFDLETKYGSFDLIKYDIEGSEWESIHPGTLKNLPKIWIGEYHSDLTKQPIQSFINRFDKYDVSIRKINKTRFMITAKLK